MHLLLQVVVGLFLQQRQQRENLCFVTLLLNGLHDRPALLFKFITSFHYNQQVASNVFGELFFLCYYISETVFDVLEA